MIILEFGGLPKSYAVWFGDLSLVWGEADYTLGSSMPKGVSYV